MADNSSVDRKYQVGGMIVNSKIKFAANIVVIIVVQYV